MRRRGPGRCGRCGQLTTHCKASWNERLRSADAGWRHACHGDCRVHCQLDRSTRPVKRVRELRRHVLYRLEQRLAKLRRLSAGVSRGVVLRRGSLLVRRDFDSMRVRLRGPDDQSRKLWELRQWMRGSRMSCWGVLGGLWSVDRVRRSLRGFGFEPTKLRNVRKGM